MASSRSIRALVGSWVAYWSVLAIVKLGPAAVAIWKATRGPEGTGSVNFSFSNDQFTLNVIERGETTYTASSSLLVIGLWVAGPPLVAWIVWAMRKRKATPEPSRHHEGA